MSSKKAIASVLALGLASQFALMGATAVRAENSSVSDVSDAYISSNARTMFVCGDTEYDNGGDSGVVTPTPDPEPEPEPEPEAEPEPEPEVEEDNNSSGGSSGGSSSGGSSSDDSSSSNNSSSSDSSDTTELPDLGELPDDVAVEVEGDVVKVEVSATVVGDVAVTEVSEEVLTSIVDAVIASGMSEISLSVAVSAEGAAQVNLPTASLTAMAEAGVSVTIPSTVGTMALSSSALTSILSQIGAGATVEIAISTVSTDSLNSAQQAVLAEKADRPVFDFSVGAGGTKLADFGGAAVELAVPFKLPSGVSGDKVQVRALGGDGSVKDLPTSYANSSVNFSATESALFMVDYD